MQRPGGYATWTDPDRPLIERDTVTCSHCDRIIFVKPNTASTIYLLPQPAGAPDEEVPGAGCYVCWKPICLRCHAKGVCTPLEARLAALEGRPVPR